MRPEEVRRIMDVAFAGREGTKMRGRLWRGSDQSNRSSGGFSTGRRAASLSGRGHFLVRNNRDGKPTLPAKGSLALSDPDRETLFKAWLVDHDRVIHKVARAYSLTAEDRQDLVPGNPPPDLVLPPAFPGQSQWIDLVLPGRPEHGARLAWQGDAVAGSASSQFFIGNEPTVAGADSAEQAAERDQLDQLYAAIHQLSRTDTALVLLYLDDLSYRQMAEVLGISESNVGVKLNRAKKTLSELMENSR